MPRASCGATGSTRPVGANRIVGIGALHGVIGQRQIAAVRANGPR